MQRGWFYKLLFSYLPIFTIITSLLVIISFSSMFMLSNRSAKQSNDAFTHYAMQVMDHSLMSIDQALYKEIETNEHLRQYFYSNDNEDKYFTVYQPSRKLNDILLSSPLIDSIYMYKSSDRSVLTQSMLMPVDHFIDKGFIDRMSSHPDSFRWSGRREYQETSARNPKQVVSLVKKVPVFTGSHGMVVINVRIDSLNKLLSDLMGDNIIYLNLYDRDGHSMLEDAGEPVENKSILARNQDDMSRVSSEYTGWEIHSGFKDWKWMEKANALFIGLASFSILAIALGMAWIVYVTRKNYRPIESITLSISSFLRQKSSTLLQKSGKDEFKFIETALHNMIEQSNRYLEQHEENLMLRRQVFFQELIEGGRPIEDEEFILEMNRYGLPESIQSSMLAVVEIDQYADFCVKYSHHDQNLFKFILSTVVKELSDGSGDQIWVEWISPFRLGIICFFKKEESMDNGTGIIRKYIEWVSLNLDLTVTAGVGTPIYHVSDFTGSYDHAVEALNYKPVLGSNRIIESRQVSKFNHGEVHSHLESIRIMTRTFRLGQEQWKQQYEVFFEKLSNEVVPRKDIVSLINYMIYYLQREFLDLSVELADVWGAEIITQLHAAVEHFETIEELRGSLRRTLTEFYDKMNVLRQRNGNYAMMLKVKDYIQQHYASPDLSLAHLSDAFGISAKYLSLLFKEEMGEKFIDYLATVRTENAKALLAGTNDPIQDIAQKVGYLHPFSFIRLFKKQVGMTPGDYRKEFSSTFRAME